MARTKIGVGVIGMGWMGGVHSRAYREVADRFPDCPLQAELVICADEVEGRAKEGQARFGFARSTTDWQSVVADPEVGMVVIAAPNYLHLETACAAAAAGKHLLCEKPVGRSPAETARIAQAARQAGVLSCTGFNYRWAPAVQRARQLIREGKLGTLTHYRGWLFVGYASDQRSVLSWRLQRERAGMGALGDLMSHAIDMALMLAGPIARVVGQEETFIKERPVATPGQGDHYAVKSGGPMQAVDNEDYVGALVRFAGGARGTLETCRVIQGPQSEIGFEVHGTKGSIRWDFERMNEFELYLAEEGGVDPGYRRVLASPRHPFHAPFSPGPGIGLGYDDLKVIEAYNFLLSIAKGVQGEPGFGEVLAVAEVQAAIERSWQSERWEEIRPL
jgi:predicted dehydrogenase